MFNSPPPERKALGNPEQSLQNKQNHETTIKYTLPETKQHFRPCRNVVLMLGTSTVGKYSPYILLDWHKWFTMIASKKNIILTTDLYKNIWRDVSYNYVDSFRQGGKAWNSHESSS